MGKLSTASFYGASGDKYPFDVYNWETIFREGLQGVYCIGKRYKLSSGSFTIDPIFIGEMSDLSRLYGFHRKQMCFQRNGANVRCIYEVKDNARRKVIVADLLEEYDTPCND